MKYSGFILLVLYYLLIGSAVTYVVLHPKVAKENILKLPKEIY